MAITTTTGTTFVNGDTVTAANLDAVVNNMTVTMATNRLIGRSTAGTGTIEEITPSPNLVLSAGGLDLLGCAFCSVTTNKASAGYVDVAGLSVSLSASTVYAFRAFIFGLGSAGAGGGIQMGGSAVAAGYLADGRSWDGTTFTGVSLATNVFNSPVISVGAASTYWTIEINGYINVSVAGNISVQVGRTSGVGTSTVQIGSNLRVWKVA